MSGLLNGVRVVDMSVVLAGPFAAQALAEMGADVVKVEPPGGDPARGIGPHRNGRSLYFSALNSGKRGMVVDLASPQGLDQFHTLLDHSDILIGNLRPAAARKLDLHPDAVIARHPKLVYVRISGYASGTPWEQLGAYDLITQAESGIMAVTGTDGGEPVRAGVAISDLAAGLWAALGAAAAYAGRLRTGRGRYIEVPLLDAAMSLLTYMAADALETGMDPGPVGSGHHSIVPYRAYPTADGHLVLAVIGDKFWPMLCNALGLEDLAAREDLRTNPGRVAARSEIDGALVEAFADLATDEALARLAAAGVPHGRVNGILSAVGSPYAAATGSVLDIPTGDGGYRIVHGPLYDGRPLRPAPALGEHTAEILAELGIVP